MPPARGKEALVMTKSELIELVSTKVGNFTRKDVEVIVDTLFESMSDSLAKGEKVEIRGFGSFKIKERNGRQGRNPKSGENIFIESKRIPFFKAGKEIKERINASK
jgi:integration host factor subunit beta